MHFVFCLLASALFAQSPQALSFEAASVRASQQSGRGAMRGGPGTSDPGQLLFTNVTLFNVLLRAYDVQSFQISAPDWLSTEKYNITAKVPDGATKEQCNRMLQNLLAERFHLELHHETRDLSGFELAMGRNGPRLKVSEDAGAVETPASTEPPKTDANGYPILSGPGLLMMEGVKGKSVVVFLTARSQPLSALVALLTREFRMPILDKTGQTGRFDFRLEFAPQAPGALPAASSPDGAPMVMDDSAPNLTTAVQQQLGMRLNAKKVPTDILVIDHADRVPTEN
jgi:uncharacterized protein (TIGR03435 family)